MSLPLPAPFVAAGRVEVVQLPGVTQILGTTPNSLQSIATGSFNPPYPVLVKINGLNQVWVARIGTDATDVPNGIAQAGDYAQTGIVWYMANP